MHHKQLLLDFHKVLTDQLAHISRVTAEKVVCICENYRRRVNKYLSDLAPVTPFIEGFALTGSVKALC